MCPPLGEAQDKPRINICETYTRRWAVGNIVITSLLSSVVERPFHKLIVTSSNLVAGKKKINE